MSLQFLIDDEKQREGDDEDYGEEILKMLNKDNESRVKDYENNIGVKAMSKSGTNNYIQVVIWCLLPIYDLAVFLIREEYGEGDKPVSKCLRKIIIDVYETKLESLEKR